MSRYVFSDGMPEGLVRPMYDEGFALEQEFVDPDFAKELLAELVRHEKYRDGLAYDGKSPDVYHDNKFLKKLDSMPRLAEFTRTINDTISDVTGYHREHLTWLTVRACPVGEMSSNIHRNDQTAGPWLVALTVAGSGSINIYPDDTVSGREEIVLTGTAQDPRPIASAEMRTGDVWGIYSKEWSAPHAGGPNTSLYPKVLVMIYGWGVRNQYPFRNQALDQSQQPMVHATEPVATETQADSPSHTVHPYIEALH